jgi:hypothetical protein
MKERLHSTRNTKTSLSLSRRMWEWRLGCALRLCSSSTSYSDCSCPLVWIPPPYPTTFFLYDWPFPTFTQHNSVYTPPPTTAKFSLNSFSSVGDRTCKVGEGRTRPLPLCVQNVSGIRTRNLNNDGIPKPNTENGPELLSSISHLPIWACFILSFTVLQVATSQDVTLQKFCMRFMSPLHGHPFVTSLISLRSQF